MKASSDSNPNAASLTNDQKLQHNILSMDAYCEVLAEVFDRYNQGFDELGEWIRCLLGCAGSGEEYVGKLAINRAKASSATVAPLIKIIISVLGQDLYLLLTRWKQYPSHKEYKRNAYSRLITGVSLALLREIPWGGDKYTTLLVDKPKSFFGNNDDNDNSDYYYLVIKAFVTDWVMQGNTNTNTDTTTTNINTNERSCS